MEWMAIVSVFVLVVWLFAQIVEVIRPDELPWLGLTALLAYLAADFLSGCCHWAADTLGDADTPLFGANIIRPFREHHTDPDGITRHDMVETNGNSCIFALPFLVPATLFAPAETGPSFYLSCFVGFTMMGMVATNQFHKWAHAAHPGRLVRLLQRVGLVLDRGHHDMHHQAPHRSHYCITTGWLNPLLDRVRFFRAAERAVGWFFPSLLEAGRRQSTSSRV